MLRGEKVDLRSCQRRRRRSAARGALRRHPDAVRADSRPLGARFPAARRPPRRTAWRPLASARRIRRHRLPVVRSVVESAPACASERSRARVNVSLSVWRAMRSATSHRAIAHRRSRSAHVQLGVRQLTSVVEPSTSTRLPESCSRSAAGYEAIRHLVAVSPARYSVETPRRPAELIMLPESIRHGAVGSVRRGSVVMSAFHAPQRNRAYERHVWEALGRRRPSVRDPDSGRRPGGGLP